MQGSIYVALLIFSLSLFFSHSSMAQTQRIEAEDYMEMSGIEVEPTSDEGGGSNIGWIDVDDWITYNVPLTAGEYRFSYRVAGHDGDERFLLQSEDGQITYSNVAFESTGSWQNWVTVDTTVELDSDIDSFRTYAVDGEWNINWFEITPLSQSTSSSAGVSSSVASSDISSTAASSNSPSSETSSASAGFSASSSESYSSSGSGEYMRRIEAEDYLNIDGMQVEPTEDVGGGENVGWIDTDDWMSYRVNLPEAGEYKVRFRVAGRGETLDRFVLESDDIEGLSQVVPFEGTGGWQLWKTVERSVELTEGEHILIIRALGGDWNINWIEFHAGSYGSNSSSESSQGSVSSSSHSEVKSSSSAGSSSSFGSSSSSRIYTVTALGSNGIVTPEHVSVKGGEDTVFSIVPDPGYYVKNVRNVTSGVGCDGDLNDNKYTIYGVSEDCLIEVYFEEIVSSPRKLVGIGGNNTVTLKWYSVPEADYYNVYYSANPGIEPSADGLRLGEYDKIESVASPFEMLSLINGEKYHVVVTAVKGEDESKTSNEIEITPSEAETSINDRYYVKGESGEFVRDIRTELEWKRCAVGQTWSGSTCEGEAELIPRKDQGSKGEDGGWHVPSVDDLRSLVFCDSGVPEFWNETGDSCSDRYYADESKTPTIIEEAFPNSPSSNFGGVWADGVRTGSVNFARGSAHYITSDSYPRYIRLMRYIQYKDLFVRNYGTGSGLVISDDSQINCGENCDYEYSDPKIVTLTAIPSGISEFSGWGGSCSGNNVNCTVTTDEHHLVEATFDVPVSDKYEFLGSDEQVVRDLRTGLEWKRCEEGQEWTGTKCYGGRSFDHGSFGVLDNGWRSPTIEELRTLVFCSGGDPSYWSPGDKGCEGEFKYPAIDQKAFPGATGAIFWSSSSNEDEDEVWALSFEDGAVGSVSKSGRYYRRLVRDEKKFIEAVITPESQVVPYGERAVLDASRSRSEGSNISYVWKEWLGPVLGEGSTIEMSDLEVGTHRFQIHIVDSNGSTYRAITEIVVAHKPEAVVNLEKSRVFVGDQVTLDASGSSSESGFVRYEWVLNGEVISRASKVDVSIDGEGPYGLKLIVTSNEGLSDTENIDIEVLPSIDALEHCSLQSNRSDYGYTPKYPKSNIEWTGGKTDNVLDIERAFNYARFNDPSVHTYLMMPPQEAWDEMAVQDKGLYLVNAERAARGLKPYSGYASDMVEVARDYSSYIHINNEVIGHYNDGRSPMDRMLSNSYIQANSDSFILKPESLASFGYELGMENQGYAVTRSVYNWIYDDKDWYLDFGLDSGEDWGHRNHVLQYGLKENSGTFYSEGVVGFGVATGLYQPGAESPSTHGAVTVFKTIDQGYSWDSDRIQTVDISSSQGCLPYELDISDDGTLLDGLEGLSIDPSNIHMAMGQSQALSVTGRYEDGLERDLTDNVSFVEDDYSVVRIDSGAIVGLRPGHANVYAKVGSVESNRVRVTVGERVDADSLADTEAASVAPYLADNATLPAALPTMEEESVEAGFDPKSMAVYTGIAHDRYGVPMSGVQVSFLNARNYGSVVTDTEGRFIIAGPAGEQTLVYEKPGYLVIQRSAITASSQWASLETVTLLERDSKTTTIDLSSEDPQVHESSVVSDEFGDRRATVVFNGITSAVIRSADGSERPVEQFEFSATEFETPASMPRELPRETGFTWASDLHVDGVHYTDSVHFNGSVVMFVDNFLNFDVGEIVPIGYFDRRVSEWVASSNGVVVELLDSDGDGVVDGLDYTGDGLPDDLNGNGDTGDEAVGLDSYSAGDTLWWGSFNHMTPMDYNWGAGDGEAPEDVEPELSEEDEYDEDCVATGSYAKPYQQSFHEDIDIAGSNVTLHYSSQRTQGYHHKIRVALSGDDLPVMPVRMIARLDIAGNVFEKHFDPQVGLEAEFLWDGTHPDGTIAKGAVNGRVSLGYEHSVKYLSAGNAASEDRQLSEFPVAWAVEGESETLVSSRENFIAWRQRGVSIKNTYDTQLADGWSLSSVHELGPNSQGLVYLGNGGAQTIATPSLILRTGQTFSYEDGDDGDYQAGGKGIDYTITSDNILQDLVTGLQWQNERKPHRTTSKLEAGQYCDDLDLAGQTDWRLPTPKEIGYSIDKSSGDALRRIHSLSRARDLWTRSTLNVDERELAALCVRGVELDLQNIDALERNETDQVAVDQDNGLMWQDGPDNASLELDWFDSIDYCETSQHAGYDNWRLPNINELLYVLPNSVFQHQTSFPDDTPWSPTAPERNTYWSSTTNIADEDQAWAIESLGFNSERFEKDDTYHVRCVRDDSTSSRSPFRFNGDGLHTATIDLSSGAELSNLEYDDSGRVVRIVDQFGNALTVERNHEGTPVRLVAPDGEITELSVNQQGNLTEVMYEDNTRYQFSYGNEGLLTGKTDPNGHKYDREYSGSGRLTMARDPQGGFWELFDERLGIGWDRYGYETAESNRHEIERRVLDNGDVEVTTTDQTGAQSTVLRSADELTETITAYGMTTVLEKVLDQKTERPRTETITVTTPDGLASTTTLDKVYGENGADTSRYTVTASQNGKPVVTEVDSRSGVTKTTSAEGRVTTLHTDTETLLTQRVERPGQHEREYEYDSRGRLTVERVGDRSTTYTYDDIAALGQLTRITAPDGLSTHFEYDLLGRVTKVTYPDGNSTVTTYDANGNATRVTVPTSEDHTSAFNGVNKVATENRPETAPTRYTYNLERQLTQVELPSGETIDHIYEDGRRVRTYAPEASTNYHYQHGDQLARVERDAEKAHYGYDGTLQTELRYEGLVNTTLGYGYNADFQIDSLSYAGASTSVGYDDDGLITAINGFDLTYDAQSGFLEELKDGNLTQTWQWNGYGESIAVDYYQSGHNTYGYSLEYNTAGQIDRKTEQAPNGGLSTYEYGYDDRGRLVEVIKDGVIVEAYAYDANGNRTLQTSTEAGVEAESATYTAGDQLESRGDTTYDYDANGRLSGKVEETDAGPAVTTYVYGSQGQLLQVDSPDESIEYRHNALGQRVAKLIDGEIVERYLWQDLTTLLATYDGSGNLKQRFEYTVGHTPTSFTQGGQRYYIQTDHLGSPRAVTDCAARRAVAAPIPRLPPVISITFFNEPTSITSHSPARRVHFLVVRFLYQRIDGTLV